MWSQGGWEDAAGAAAKADATVVIVGLDVTQECEGHDRTNVTAPGGQNAFVKQVCDSAAGKPQEGFELRTVLRVDRLCCWSTGHQKACVVLIMSGSAVDSSEIEALPSVGAVMWVGYPGERGGEAIANAVFGISDEFGKMSFSIYKQAYYDHLSPLDFNMRPNATTGSEGRTYRFCKAS